MNNSKINESIFGIHAPFLCQYWDAENCIPENWEYSPSTYGVKGVHLVSGPHMMLWSELKPNWNNPGRKGGVSFAHVEEIGKDIKNNGINTKEGSVIYYDVDTKDKINAFHRELVSSNLDIPGWMAQAVKFDTKAAKVRFALKSNNRKNLPHNNSSSADVETAVREVLELENTFTKDALIDEINDLGYHLPESTREGIRDRLMVEFLASGIEMGVRYIPHNAKTIQLLLPNIDNEWMQNIWKNEDENCLIVYMSHVEGRIGSLLTSNVKSLESNKPLHILFSVPTPEGKESIESKREKVFSTHMASVENRVLTSMGLGEIHRKVFTWNHPDAQHRFVAQDTSKEMYNELIYVKNRIFN